MMKLKSILCGGLLAFAAVAASAAQPAFLPYGSESNRVWAARDGCWLQMAGRQQLINLNAAPFIGSVEVPGGTAFTVMGTSGIPTLVEPMSAAAAKDLYLQVFRCLTSGQSM